MKRVLNALLSVMLLLALPTVALADTIQPSRNDWQVEYTTAGKMKDNFTSDFYNEAGNLEPGDDITLSVKLVHSNDTAADWYMSNEVVKSLETSVAEGSAYGYRLTYTGPDGNSRTLFDSGVVGGDDTEGLAEATNALEDYLFLDNLSKGKTATVQLHVELDGETEGNAYFDTFAQIRMRFAVEPTVEPEDTVKERTVERKVPGENVNRTVVRTGDETRLFPYYVAMFVSGLLLLWLAFVSLRERKQEREEGTR